MIIKLVHPYQQEMLNNMVQYVISNHQLFEDKDRKHIIPFMGTCEVHDPVSDTKLHNTLHNSMMLAFVADINNLLDEAYTFSKDRKILQHFFKNIVYFAAVKNLEIPDEETLMLMVQHHEILK